MRILHVITGLSTGGAERALFNVLAGGLGKAADVAVVSLRDEGTFGPRIRKLGVPVYSLGIMTGVPGLGAIARLRALLRELQPDVIQGWMYHGNLAASVASRLLPVRPAVAWNIRQSLYSLEGEKRLTRQVIRANRWLSTRADAIVYNSRLSRQQHEGFGFAGNRSRVIPNGFDLAAFRPNCEAGIATRRTLSLSEDVLVVGHVARFHPMKDHATFLRAAVQVAAEEPRARFLLVGREVNLGNPALAGIVPLDLMGRFTFLEERHDVPTLMQAMDVFCQSSWSEAFPNVLGEAMASAVPAVATDVGDSADIVGDTGIVVPPSDSAALARGVMAMLKKPDSERRALGRAARGRIEANYALPQIVDLYRDLYEALGLSRKNNRTRGKE